MSSQAVSLRGLRKSFKETPVVHDFSLDIAQGELIALLGPSGCGKTTVLRMIAGFERPDQGQILIGAHDVTAIAPQQRHTAMVFQRYALFPHLTVQQNVAFGLQMHRVPKPQQARRIDEVLERVQMGAYAKRLPHQLSGGQQQRVAIARALAIEPQVLLLDEPLSNLDAKQRADVRQEIRVLQQSLGLTTILVTHDQEEAMTMADRVVLLHQGRIEQVGTPDQVYAAPASRYVAGFLGRMNFLEGRTDHAGFRSQAGTLLQAPFGSAPGATTLGIRPERITLQHLADRAPLEPTDNALPVTVTGRVFLGASVEFHVRTSQGETLVCQLPNGSAHHAAPFELGQALIARFRSTDCIPLP